MADFRKLLYSLMLCMVILITGCGTVAVVQHPGALNPTDNGFYDTLLTEHAALLTLKANIGSFPALTPSYTALKQEYAATHAAYLVWRTSVQTNTVDPTQAAALSVQIAILVQDISKLLAQLGGSIEPTKSPGDTGNGR